MARKLFSLIGEVLIDNDKANDSLAKTDKAAGGVGDKLGKGVKAAGKFAVGMGAAMATAGAAVFALAKKTSETTDRIDKMSQQLGLSRTGFQEWEYVLSQNGVSMDSMSIGMKTLAQKMGDVVAGTGPGVALFEQLGVAVTDSTGAVKTQEEVFGEAITALQNMEDGIVKADLAQQLFGRSGQELLPTLNLTAEATAALKQQATDLGLVLSDETVDAGVNFTDTMNQLQRTLGGLLANALGPLLPMINDLAQEFIKILPSLMAFIQPLLEKLVPVIGELLAKLLPAFIRILDAVLPVLDPLIDAFMLLIDTIFLPLIDLLVPIIEALMPGLISVFDTLIPVLTPILGLFAELVQMLLPVLVDMINTLLPILLPFIELFADLALNIMPIINALFKAFKPLLDAIVPILEIIWDLIGPLIEGVSKVVSGIGNFIGGLFGKKDKDVPGLATGGSVTRSGMALVGESGPELLNLPRGANVVPLNSTANNMQVTANYNITDRATAEWANNDLVRKIQGRGLAVGYR